MMPKTDRRIERTKSTLIATFQKLVLERGFSKVKVKDIVDEANYNRTTFYVHYVGKEQLAKEMIELEMARFCYEFCKPVRDNPILDLTKMSPNETDVFQYMKDNSYYYDLLVIQDPIPGICEALLEVLKDMFQNRFSFIGDKAAEINADYFTHYRAYGIYGWLLEWIRAGYDATPSEMARRIINLLHYHSSLMREVNK
ncbi:TetR family transcriptional regulator [Terribacillus saccharophilus]|uniref:TetR family transcriptional regulator n=2 Tax=Terribacillus saccharophilus TaxID=361277 RepID=A0ABX4GW78_9BACI|nr:TetR family transcriptional regulator [Terribacillus saccharophilus]PAD95548.1 TetR family transcriptional regulator [Terribacillus saccharophilus]PAD99127.1 TetR family transcriptional regulator [Terribacillus saccharophilus]